MGDMDYLQRKPRSELISCRVTEADRQIIERVCDHWGCSMSAYVASSALKCARKDAAKLPEPVR